MHCRLIGGRCDDFERCVSWKVTWKWYISTSSCAVNYITECVLPFFSLWAVEIESFNTFLCRNHALSDYYFHRKIPTPHRQQNLTQKLHCVTEGSQPQTTVHVQYTFLYRKFMPPFSCSSQIETNYHFPSQTHTILKTSLFNLISYKFEPNDTHLWAETSYKLLHLGMLQQPHEHFTRFVGDLCCTTHFPSPLHRRFTFDKPFTSFELHQQLSQ